MDITIILPISRIDFLPQVFARLEILNCDKNSTNLLTIVDGDYNLFTAARNFTVNSKFAQKLCIYRAKGEPNVGSVHRRRERIAAIHNELKEKIQHADYLLLIEDDTLIPTDTLTKLLPVLQSDLNTALVSGVQLGRWGYRHIGGWIADDVYNVQTITSVPLESGVMPIHGAGLYCTLIRKDLYMSHKFESFESALGCDFNLGLQLKREGYKVYMHHGVLCGHLTKKENIHPSDGKIDQVQLVKKNDEWVLGLLPQVMQ